MQTSILQTTWTLTRPNCFPPPTSVGCASYVDVQPGGVLLCRIYTCASEAGHPTRFLARFRTISYQVRR